MRRLEGNLHERQWHRSAHLGRIIERCFLWLAYAYMCFRLESCERKINHCITSRVLLENCRLHFDPQTMQVGAFLGARRHPLGLSVVDILTKGGTWPCGVRGASSAMGLLIWQHLRGGGGQSRAEVRHRAVRRSASPA
jgi:hypothetical protein